MSSTAETSGTENQEVGRVAIIYNDAKAISVDGMERQLSVDSPVFAYDRIITESDGKVVIVIDDDARSQIDLSGMSNVIIDEDIFGAASPQEIAEAAAEMEEVREAFYIADIDLAVETKAAALEDTGHTVADFDSIAQETDISSTAADNYSVIFHESDYTDLDNGAPGDPLDSLIDTDDSTS